MVSQLETSFNGMQSFSNFISVPDGTDVTIQCQFSGMPTANVVWYRDGTMITTGIETNLSIFLSTLSLSDIQTAGVYQCHVSNEFGRDTATLFLCRETPGDENFNLCALE